MATSTPAVDEASIRKVAGASLLGSVVEWYDFFLYGTMAALVFNTQFFPEYDPLVGTMIAFAMVRHRFRGKSASNVLVFVPMATPEIVLGASLLTIFVQGFSRVGLELGFWTIVIAHIMFCLSFVVVTVRARLQSLDPRMEEAAQDLYAGPGETFWRVTLPLVLPGMGSGAVLGVPMPILIWLTMGAAVGLAVRRTALGLLIEAVGINRRAAMLVGVRARFLILATYAISGLCAAMAGMSASAMSRLKPMGATATSMPLAMRPATE